jgi:anaerobic selenocysteine-containing dehydrogenase
MPGTDAALALGMTHVIVAENLHDQDYVSRHTFGFEQLCDRLAAYPPARAAELTCLAAEEVGDLVRPGVVIMPSGWWASLSVGGASANPLTLDGLSDLGDGGDFHDTRVEVECART